MSDPNQARLEDMRTQRIPDFDLGNAFLYPQYDGGSILNIPSTIMNWLGAGPLGSPPLHADLLDGLDEQYRQVILVLVDALAYARLAKWASEGDSAVWGQLADVGKLIPLTSISPSTTSAALTTFWTGQPPARHGITGYETWLKEYGLVANMIFHAPFSFGMEFGSLSRAGFDPRAFLKLPTMGSHLQAAGVQAHAFQNELIINSGLSEMFFDDVERHGFLDENDLWSQVRALLEARRQQRNFLWVYWEQVDSLSHTLGPDADEVYANFAGFSRAFQREIAESLSPEARRETLLLLAADHGSVHTPDNPHYDLRHHPNLLRRLHIMPTGENRMAYLHVRPGQTEAVREYIERTWPRQFTVIETANALHAGLLGPGEQHPGLADRAGDLIALAHENAYWWWGDRPNPLLGRHGGLTEADMLVPLLATPLDRL
jgi:hypothetical protein